MQRPCKVDELQVFMTIKLNDRILDFWRYSPVWAIVSQFFHTFRGTRGDELFSYFVGLAPAMINGDVRKEGTYV